FSALRNNYCFADGSPPELSMLYNISQIQSLDVAPGRLILEQRSVKPSMATGPCRHRGKTGGTKELSEIKGTQISSKLRNLSALVSICLKLNLIQVTSSLLMSIASSLMNLIKFAL